MRLEPSFTFEPRSGRWSFRSPPDLRLDRAGLSVAVFGTIVALRRDIPGNWQPFDEDLLLELTAANGPRIALYCDGDFVLVCAGETGAFVAVDFFGADRLFYEAATNGVRFFHGAAPEQGPHSGAVSGYLLEKSGYTDGHDTGIAGLSKTVGGEVLRVDASGVRRENLLRAGECWFSDTRYDTFRPLMLSELDRCFAGLDHAVIEFSGGTDSTMIARYAQIKGVRSTLVTATATVDGKGYDEASARRAVRFAKRWRQHLVHFYIDLERLSAQTERLVAAILASMPFVRHPTRLIAAIADMSARAIDPGEAAAAFNGQNSDSIVALGPTEPFRIGIRGFLSGSKGLVSRLFLYIHNRGLIGACPGWVRRFAPLPFRSEIHFLVAFHYTALGYLALLSRRRWRRLYPDVDFDAFLSAFRQRIEGEYSGYSPQEIIYNLKLKMFLQGGDMQVVLKAHKEAGLPLRMPFKSIDIFLFFMQKQMTAGDILSGKRYIKRLAAELLSGRESAPTSKRRGNHWAE